MPGQSGPGSNGNEGLLCIAQSPSITGNSPSNCLVSYLEHSLGWGVYPSAKVQLVYSTAPANWAKGNLCSQNDLVVMISDQMLFFFFCLSVFLSLYNPRMARSIVIKFSRVLNKKLGHIFTILIFENTKKGFSMGFHLQ